MRGSPPPGGTAPRPPSPPTLRRVRAAVFGELCSSFHPSRLCCLCRSWWPSPQGTQLTRGLLVFPFSHSFSPFPPHFPLFLLVFPFSSSLLPFPPPTFPPQAAGSRLAAPARPLPRLAAKFAAGNPAPQGWGHVPPVPYIPCPRAWWHLPSCAGGLGKQTLTRERQWGGVRDFSPHPTHGAPRKSAFPPVFWVSQPSPPSPGGCCLLTIKDIL